MNHTPGPDRKSLIKLLIVTATAPLVLTGSWFGAGSPSKKITVGCIGVDWLRPLAAGFFFAFTTLLVALPLPMDGTDGHPEPGFIPLFNGKNLDGWYVKIKSGDPKMSEKVFTADDGMIHVFRDLPDGYQLNLGQNDTHGMIYTVRKFSRFILRFEYKWGKKQLNNFDQFQYDAGCYYHVVEDKIWPKGIEYQVRYNHLTRKNHTGDFWASGLEWYCGPADTFILPQDGGKLKLGHAGEHLALGTENHHGLDDQWNECEVIAMADEYVIHKLNGQIVNYATKLPYREGVIGLQSETAEVFYRNIRIKEFAESVQADQFLKKPAT